MTVAIDVTKKTIKQVEKFARHGLNKTQIAAALGWSRETLYEKMRNHPDILDAIDRGKGQGIGKVCNALFDKAIGGDVPASRIYLQQVAGWSEKLETKSEIGPMMNEEELKDRLTALEDELRDLEDG